MTLKIATRLAIFGAALSLVISFYTLTINSPAHRRALGFRFEDQYVLTQYWMARDVCFEGSLLLFLTTLYRTRLQTATAKPEAPA
jgi:hypothetical protein